MVCPKCRRGELARVGRVGILRRAYLWLGIFPWQCESCNQRTLLRMRGDWTKNPHDAEVFPQDTFPARIDGQPFVRETDHRPFSELLNERDPSKPNPDRPDPDQTQ